MRYAIGHSAIALSILLAGCEVRKDGSTAAGAGQPVAAPSLSKAEAEKTVRDELGTFLSGDASKVIANYAPGAVAFDSGHAELTSDRNLMTQWATEYIALKPADLVANPIEIQLLDAETFVASGVMSFTGDVNGHRDLFHARYSQVFEKQADGRWLIVHEHMSSPPNAAVG